MAKDQVAKILVVGEKKASLSLRKSNDLVVIQARGQFGYIEHVVAGIAELCDQRRSNALVCQP